MTLVRCPRQARAYPVCFSSIDDSIVHPLRRRGLSARDTVYSIETILNDDKLSRSKA